MMCAHSPPLAADAPAGQHLSEKILDGDPSILEAVIYLLVTLPTLAAVVVCVGPLVSTVMPLFKWLWLLIRYNRLMGGLE